MKRGRSRKLRGFDNRELPTTKSIPKREPPKSRLFRAHSFDAELQVKMYVGCGKSAPRCGGKRKILQHASSGIILRSMTKRAPTTVTLPRRQPVVGFGNIGDFKNEKRHNNHSYEFQVQNAIVRKMIKRNVRKKHGL